MAITWGVMGRGMAITWGVRGRRVAITWGVRVEGWLSHGE